MDAMRYALPFFVYLLLTACQAFSFNEIAIPTPLGPITLKGAKIEVEDRKNQQGALFTIKGTDLLVKDVSGTLTSEKVNMSLQHQFKGLIERIDALQREHVLVLRSNIDDLILFLSKTNRSLDALNHNYTQWDKPVDPRTSDYFEANRAALGRGVVIRRLFVFPKDEWASNKDRLLHVLEKQIEAGIQTWVACLESAEKDSDYKNISAYFSSVQQRANAGIRFDQDNFAVYDNEIVAFNTQLVSYQGHDYTTRGIALWEKPDLMGFSLGKLFKQNSKVFHEIALSTSMSGHLSRKLQIFMEQKFDCVS